MAESSDIGWLNRPGHAAGATWQIVIGCSRVDHRCDNCYAIRVVHNSRHEGHRGLTKLRAFDASRPGPDWNGEVRLQPDQLGKPLHWKKGKLIFPCSLSDLFHPAVPFEYLAAAFGVMAATRQHTYLILTKRIDRYAEFMAWIDKRGEDGRSMFPHDEPSWRIGQMLAVSLKKVAGLDGQRPATQASMWEDFDPRRQPWPLSNVWIGASVSDQPTADLDLPKLVAAPAAHRWVSYEPGTGPVNFRPWLPEPAMLRYVGPEMRALGYTEGPVMLSRGPKLKWLVPGGESDRDKARRFDADWMRSVIAQGAETGTPVFCKQIGSNPFDGNRRMQVKAWKGDEPSEWPEDLRVQQFPEFGP